MPTRQTTLEDKRSGGIEQTIWRVSVVRAYYSTLDRDTPSPFCETRAFIFLKEKPTNIKKQILYRRLSSSINNLEEYAFYSLAQATNNESAESQDQRTSTQIKIKEIKDKKNVVVEINGYEFESVDADEIRESLGLSERDIIRFGYVYNFFTKRDEKGRILKNSVYNDRRIKSMLSEQLSLEKLMKSLTEVK
jgi:hypothetical protein